MGRGTRNGMLNGLVSKTPFQNTLSFGVLQLQTWNEMILVESYFHLYQKLPPLSKALLNSTHTQITNSFSFVFVDSQEA